MTKAVRSGRGGGGGRAVAPPPEIFRVKIFFLVCTKSHKLKLRFAKAPYRGRRDTPLPHPPPLGRFAPSQYLTHSGGSTGGGGFRGSNPPQSGQKIKNKSCA